MISESFLEFRSPVLPHISKFGTTGIISYFSTSVILLQLGKHLLVHLMWERLLTFIFTRNIIITYSTAGGLRNIAV